MDRPYNILGVEPGSDFNDIKAAYRELMKEHHPDHGGTTEEFIRVKKAYQAIQHRIESGRDTRPIERQPGTGTTATTDGGTTTAPQARNHSTESVTPTTHTDQTIHSGKWGVELQLHGKYLKLSLVAVTPALDISKVVRLSNRKTAPRRPVACFTVENTSNRTIRWRGNQCTTFHTADGSSYEQSRQFRPSDSVLPGEWIGSDVPIRAGEGMHNVVVAERIPRMADLEMVEYTQNVFGASGIVDKERFVFELPAGVTEELSRLPF